MSKGAGGSRGAVRRFARVPPQNRSLRARTHARARTFPPRASRVPQANTLTYRDRSVRSGEVHGFATAMNH
eukprot:11991553-Alexandrium_andersonii.AAC.1